MKFDYCVQNPPYGAGMHIDFVNLSVRTSKEIICIHPSGPFINRRNVKKNKRIQKLIDNLKSYYCEIELIDGNAIFDAGFLTPLSVTYIDTTRKHDGIHVSGYYDAIVDVDEMNMIGEWVIKYYRNMPKQNLLSCASDTGNYFVNIGLVRGHPPEVGKRFNPDFFTMVPESTIVETSSRDKWSSFGFETEIEAKRFLKYIKTKFARFWLSLYKMNIHLDSGELAAIPYIDFTKDFDENELFSRFGMSDDREKIEELIEDYYDVDYITRYGNIEDARKFTDKIDRKRQKITKEFFTPDSITNKMLDRCDITKTFFEPACGDGNILELIVRRKLEAGQTALQAISSIYACEYMFDNRNAAIERLIAIVGEEHRTLLQNRIAHCNTIDSSDTSDGRIFPSWLKFENSNDTIDLSTLFDI